MSSIKKKRPRKKKCKGCGDLFQPPLARPLAQVCSPRCAIAYQTEQKKRKAKKERQEFNQEDINWTKEKLQQTVNTLAREIDRGLPCLATGKTGGQMHGGHVYSRGAHTQMRFNLHNIHRQTAYSNTMQSHDGLMQEKLADEYGPEYLQYLKQLRGSPVLKLSAKEYYSAHRKGLKLIKKVQRKDNRELNTPAKRIALRNECNAALGIYPPSLAWFNV